VNLVADLVRDMGPESGARTLAAVNEVKSQGVIGIGIGGSELSFPPEPFAAVYERARELGFHTSAHAGEAAGAQSVWGAIRALKVDRIGHGTRAFEDPALVEYLAEKRVPLEVCPLSNVRTGVVPSIEKHPLRLYFDRGLALTISTDDPKMFNNSLAEEYALLESRLGFSRTEVRGLVLSSLEHSWLPDSEKASMMKEFRESEAWKAG
jgi:adenosine deaminase